MRLALLALLPAVALAGCQKPPHHSQAGVIDNGMISASADDEALRDVIHVDPARSSDAAAATPVLATRGTASNGCIERFGPTLAYDKAWAAKLPAAMPVKPDATLSEAAGHDGGGCAVRIASFTVPGERDAALAWYADRAKAAGYSARRADRGGDHVLAGTSGAAAFYIIAGPVAGGATPIDYVWTRTG